MGLRWASVTNMGKLPWTKPNLTCVNSSEVSWLPITTPFPIPTGYNAVFSLQTLLHHTEKAEKMGQSLTKIPFKDTFWKGTTRTRPRESHTHRKHFISWPVYISRFGLSAAWKGKIFPAGFPTSFNVVFEISHELWTLFLGNGTLNKHAGIDYKQLSLLAKINENQSGEVLLIFFFYHIEGSCRCTRHSFHLFIYVCSCGKGAGKEMRLLLRC